MMVFHGDNQIASRKAWLEAKVGRQVLNLDGSSLVLADLLRVVNTKSLFDQDNSVFIENIFSRRPSVDKKEILTYLENNPNLDITIWENKAVITSLPNKSFDLPKYIFKFLDNPTIEGLHLVLQTMPVEQIFASLATRAHKQLKTKQITDLLQIDYKHKTSFMPYDLVMALELWITRL